VKRRRLSAIFSVLTVSYLVAEASVGGTEPGAAAVPSGFDYLVLASIADSQQPFAMVAGYQTIQTAATVAVAVPTVTSDHTKSN
jgi:hypothetical protein